LDDKIPDSVIIGKRMIETAINLDESLAELLRVEVRRLKSLNKESDAHKEMQNTGNLVRSIIIAISLTDERIKTGLELYLGKSGT
jgi:hypothetical protein